MGAAVVVTLVTGVDYTVRAIQLHRAVPHGLAGAADPPGAPGAAAVAAPARSDSANGDSAPSAGDSIAPAPTGDSPGGPGARRQGSTMTAAGRRAEDLARAAIELLIARGETVATAESLTGGLVAAALTSVPGSSAAVRGGIVAYATDAEGRPPRRAPLTC